MKVRKRGNGSAVIIPAPLVAAAGLAIGQTVEVREECGHIIIEPIPTLSYDLDVLISGITEQNRHEFIG